jgi:hypothetical protein
MADFQKKQSVLSLVLKILTKIRETRNLGINHEKHFVERKIDGRKPDKNSSLRRL